MAGENGRCVDYMVRGEGKEQRILQCWILRHGCAFIWMYTAPRSLFARHRAAVDKALEAFAVDASFADLMKRRAASEKKEIATMYGIPVLDKKSNFLVYYPSGWKLHTSRKTPRAMHCAYTGRLSPAEEEREVLLSFDVTVDDTPLSLNQYTAELATELRRSLGVPASVINVRNVDAVFERDTPVPDCDLTDCGVVHVAAAPMSGHPGRATRFRTSAFGTPKAEYELRWTVHNGKAYVMVCHLVELQPVTNRVHFLSITDIYEHD